MYRNIIADGSWLARKYYGFHLERSHATKWMSAFLGDLHRVQTERGAKSITICWDHPLASSSRKKIYEGYKSGRIKPPGYVEALAEFKGLVKHFGIIQAESEHGEADDIAATITRQWPNCLLYTIDKDWLQCVGDAHMLWAKFKAPDILVTKGNFEEVVGLPLESFGGFLALGGDISDGIKGIKGCGETIAKRIMQCAPQAVEWIISGEPDKLREATCEEGGRVGRIVEKAIAARDNVAIMNELVRLRTIKYTTTAPDEYWRSGDVAKEWCLTHRCDWLWRLWFNG